MIRLIGSATMLKTFEVSEELSELIFDNIPQNYNHLVIRGQARTDKEDTWDNVKIFFNDDTSLSYQRQWHIPGNATGNEVNNDLGCAQIVAKLSDQERFGGNISTTFFCYSNDKFYKTGLSFANNKTDSHSRTTMYAHEWYNKNPITKIKIIPRKGINFLAGTKIQILGIK